MIHFTCKQCGKRHERADAEAGALVFCTCGWAARVPWESTAPPEPTSPAARDGADEAPAPPRPWSEGRRQPERRPEPAAWDPAHCFNHPDAAAQQTCADCGVTFCDDCVTTFQADVLCGPCKNLRVRGLHPRQRVCGLAVAALVVAVIGGPASFCVVLVAAGSGVAPLGWAGVLLPLVGLALGVVALNQIEADPKVGGRALAMTGVVVGLVSAVVMGIMTALVHVQTG
jgi:hypothetical protein